MTQLLQKHWEWAKRRKTSVSECDGSATAQAELERAFVDANRAVVGWQAFCRRESKEAEPAWVMVTFASFLRSPEKGRFQTVAVAEHHLGANSVSKLDKLWRQTGFRGTAATAKKNQ